MEKDKGRKGGNGTAKKQWKCFSKLDSIMSEKHIDTSRGNLKDTGKFL